MTSSATSVARAADVQASIIERVYGRSGAHLASRLRESRRIVQGFALEIANELHEERRGLLEAAAVEVLLRARPADEIVGRFRSLVVAIDAQAIAQSRPAPARRDEE